VEVDAEGAWIAGSTAGVLKPGVVMFGEAVSTRAKQDAEEAVARAERVLVVGSSLATYSAWRLVKGAAERGVKVGIVNLGGVRGEGGLAGSVDEGDEGDAVGEDGEGALVLRVELDLQQVLPGVVEILDGG
jgi:NAD-dependent protein deacetylase/lipoamidase sirtuin 4